MSDQSRPLLAYFDVAPLVKLQPIPIATVAATASKKGLTGSAAASSSPAAAVPFGSSLLASASAHSLAAAATPTISTNSSAHNSRRPSLSGINLTAASIRPPSSSSRYQLNDLSDARVSHIRLNDRVLPPDPHSVRVLSSLGLEKLSEDDLVQRLVSLASFVPSSTSVAPLRDAIGLDHEVPPTPNTALDTRHQQLVTLLRRTMALSGTAREAALVQHAHTHVSEEDQYSCPRLCPPLAEAITPEDLIDPKWRTPFIRTAFASQSPTATAFKSLYDSFAVEDARDDVLSLHRLDVSPTALHSAFRYGVRCALLSAPTRRVFNAQVTLLADSCLSHHAEFADDLHRLLKIWTGDTRQRKMVRKSELKRQLDALDKHAYYRPSAFADPADPKVGKTQYASWLKTNALALHSQLLSLSSELQALKRQAKSVSSKLKSGARFLPTCCCVGDDDDGGGEDDDDSEQRLDLEQELQQLYPPVFIHQPGKEPLPKPPPLGKRKLFGQRPVEDKVKATTTANGSNENKSKKNGTLDPSIVDGDAAGIASEEDDTNWLRIPEEEHARTEYLAQRRELEAQHAAYRAQQKLRQDTDRVMEDIGLGGIATNGRKANAKTTNDGRRQTENMHRVYAQLLYALMSLQTEGQPTPSSSSSSPSSSSSSPSSSSSCGPFKQSVHLCHPRVHPTFRPLLTVEKHSILDTFAKLYNIEPVFRLIALLHVLTNNLQTTWSYFAYCYETIQVLEQLKRTSVWTRHETISYLVCVERLTRWSAMCATRYPFIFNIPIVFRSRDAQKAFNAARDAAAAAAALNVRRSSLTDKSSSSASPQAMLSGAFKSAGNELKGILKKGLDIAGVGQGKTKENKKEEDKMKTPTPTATPPTTATTATPTTPQPATKDDHSDDEGDGRAHASSSPSPSPSPSSSTYSTLHPLHPNSSGQSNTGTQAFRACMDLLQRCWQVLEAMSMPPPPPTTTATIANVNDGESGIVQGGVALSPVDPTASSHSIAPSSVEYLLANFLLPHLKDTFRSCFRNLTWHAWRLAVPESKRSPATAASSSSSKDHTDGSKSFESDLHLTLVLHSILGELSASYRIGEKFFFHTFHQQPSIFVESMRHSLIGIFWLKCEHYICTKRIMTILKHRYEADQMIQGSKEQQEQFKEVNEEISQVFDIYIELQWFQYALQPLTDAESVSLSSNPSNLVLLPDQQQSIGSTLTQRSSLELQHLRRWFVPLVDGFLEVVLDRIEEEIKRWEETIQKVQTSTASNNKPNTATSDVGVANTNGGGAGLVTSLQDLSDKMDRIVQLLQNKPCTLTHKRNLLDHLAKWMLLYFHYALLTPSTMSTTRLTLLSSQGTIIGGLQEELQIRYHLNAIYSTIYPPLASLTEKERDKHTKRLAEEVAKRRNSTVAAGANTTPAPTATTVDAGLVSKPAHKFGYDIDVLPGLTPSTILRLNLMRSGLTKLDSLARYLLGSTHLEHRGPSGHGCVRHLTQACAMIGQGLCDVVLPNTLFNLLRSDQHQPTRWSSMKVEKCCAELLGFLFAHVATWKSMKLHTDVIREIGMYILLEIYDMFTLELRNLSRTIVEGVAYFKRRDVSETLTRDQIHRIGEAIKLTKAFATDVMQIPMHWFESPLPPTMIFEANQHASHGNNTIGVGGVGVVRSHSLAEELGIGPYGPRTLAQDPYAIRTTTNLNVPKDSGLSPSPSPSPAAPPADQPILFLKYQVPPAWSSVPYVLCELWKTEKLLSIHQATTAVLVALYDTHTDARTSAERKVAEEKERALQLQQHEARLSEQDADAVQIGRDDDSHLLPSPPTGSVTPQTVGAGVGASEGGLTISKPPSPRTSRSNSFQLDASSMAMMAAAGPGMLLSASMRTPPSAIATSPSTPRSAAAGRTALEDALRQQSPPPPSHPHPFVVTGMARWDIYRLLQSRAKFQDDSGAQDWLSKVKKPDRPKEIEPPSIFGKFFGKAS